MTDDFLYTTLGRTGRRVFRLGLSASYRPGKAAVHEALDQGLNYFFCYGFDTHMIKVLRELPASRRQELLVVPTAYSFVEEAKAWLGRRRLAPAPAPAAGD
jgi:hypothetical protein